MRRAETKAYLGCPDSRPFVRFIYIMCMSVLRTCVLVHSVHACTCGGQKRVLDLLELELWVVGKPQFEFWVQRN